MKPVTAYERKKEPEKVRRALLDATNRLASENGMANITLDAVAKAAGVTKGGLFHHFPSKRSLLQGMFADLLQHLDRMVDEFMAKDPEPHGRFTRAYVEGVFSDHRQGDAAPSARLSVSMLSDPDLQLAWSNWLAARLKRHADTDDGETLEVIRLAADGVWLAIVTPSSASPVNFERARASMLDLTRPS